MSGGPAAAGPTVRPTVRPTVGVIGLGLIGGSLARDLAAAGWRVQGTDRDPATEAAAREARVVEGAINPAVADFLVLAVPVRAAPAWIEKLHRLIPPDRDLVVTDVGSTKRSIAEAARAAGLDRFVGSHPIAGDHRSGWSATRTGLFRDAPVWLCPGEKATAGDVERVAALWRAVGARPRTTDPDTHDRLLARASHLPQLVATALAAALADDGVQPTDLGPGGRDTTRLAGSDPTLWTDILLDNADEIAPALDTLLAHLHSARTTLTPPRDDDAANPTLHALFSHARDWSHS